MVIEGKWFADMNLTDGETFTMYMIKREKYRFNLHINFPREAKQRVRENTINIGCNTQVVQILRKKRDAKTNLK